MSIDAAFKKFSIIISEKVDKINALEEKHEETTKVLETKQDDLIRQEKDLTRRESMITKDKIILREQRKRLEIKEERVKQGLKRAQDLLS